MPSWTVSFFLWQLSNIFASFRYARPKVRSSKRRITMEDIICMPPKVPNNQGDIIMHIHQPFFFKRLLLLPPPHFINSLLEKNMMIKLDAHHLPHKLHFLTMHKDDQPFQSSFTNLTSIGPTSTPT